MSNGWAEWAASLAAICQRWQRPAGLYSMTTDRELCFLENYARYSYTAAGDIVDLGCWLGATTYALARGLADSPVRSLARPIDAIDRFIWEEWMSRIARDIGLAKEYRPGDSFIEDTRALLAPFAPLVRIRQLDLLKARPHPRPVELLFIDAMKSWPLADRLARTFLPPLIPGRSLLVQQDFADTAAIVATNHLLMWMLRDRLVPVYHVPGSCSVVFFCTGEVVPADIGRLTSERFDRTEVAQAFDYGASCISPEMRPAARLCQVAYLAERGFDEDVLAAARTLVASGLIATPQQLAHARTALATRREAAPDDRARGWIDEAVMLLDHAGR